MSEDKRAAGNLEEGLGGVTLPDVPTTDPEEEEVEVVYLLRDRNEKIVDSWAEAFKEDTERVKVRWGLVIS